MLGGDEQLPKKHKSKYIGRRRRGSVILSVVMVIGIVASAWLAVLPTFKKQETLDLQADLLASIEQGDGMIAPDSGLTEEVDYYDLPEVDPAPDIADELAQPPQITEDTIAAAPISAEDSQPEPLEINGIGILTIDKIDLRLPVSDGVSEAQLKASPGHVPETAAIGATGNAVIAGHRSYTYGQEFNRLGELKLGDIIGYQSKDGTAMRFEVFEILEIEPDDQSAFIQPEDESIITLYTCTPIRTATHRLLVKAVKIDGGGHLLD